MKIKIWTTVFLFVILMATSLLMPLTVNAQSTTISCGQITNGYTSYRQRSVFSEYVVYFEPARKGTHYFYSNYTKRPVPAIGASSATITPSWSMDGGKTWQSWNANNQRSIRLDTNHDYVLYRFHIKSTQSGLSPRTDLEFGFYCDGSIGSSTAPNTTQQATHRAQDAVQQVMSYSVPSANQKACGPENNISIRAVKASDTLIWFYVEKCGGGSFVSDGSYYLMVNGHRGPFTTYKAGSTYSRVEYMVPSAVVVAESRNLVGRNIFEVHLWPSGRNEPYKTGTVFVDGVIVNR